MRNVEPTGRTPRCRASPFRTAPIPCSRTPKWILRAPQLPAATSPPFLKARFVEVARSADPPTSSGSLGARAFSTFPDAARVAWASGGGAGGGRERRETVVPAVRQTAGEPALELRRELRVCLSVRVVLLRPLGFEAGAAPPGGPPLRGRVVPPVERLPAGAAAAGLCGVSPL